MGVCLDFDVGACAALSGKAWKVIRLRGIVLTYGSMACDSVGETGEVVHVVAGHVNEVQVCVAVFKPGGEGPLFAADQEPVATMVRFKAAEGLPLGVSGLEMVLQEVLAKHPLGEVSRVVVGRGKVIHLFIEWNTRVGWAVGDVDVEVWSALEEVVEEEVNASGGHLARADMRFQEGLNDAFVVNEKVDSQGVNHVVVGA